MTNLYIILETIFCMGITSIVYWMYLFFEQQQSITNSNSNSKLEEIKNEETTALKEIKYEDKYFEKFNKMENVFLFQEQDLKIEMEKLNELVDIYNKENMNSKVCDPLKIEELKQSAYDYMLSLFLLRLKNSYIIENTPIGNVAMNFNSDKGSFEFYSDKNIPYRYLEVISRKYVTTFQCKPLYVIMDSEIQIAEQKMKEEKEKEIIKKENIKKTKDIYSNFKNIQSIKSMQMNKSSSNARQMNPNVSNKLIPPVVQKQQNNSQILKENANRYTYLGKFSNFILLKAVDKSHHDKNHKLSYKDYVKMNLTNKANK